VQQQLDEVAAGRKRSVEGRYLAPQRDDEVGVGGRSRP
jgi:hypothetical protein